MDPLGCRRCGDPGHWEDACPHNLRACDKREHNDRIALYVARFLDGDITAIEKQHMIREENRLWYGDQLPAALSR
jgi:zinc knuckle protein